MKMYLGVGGNVEQCGKILQQAGCKTALYTYLTIKNRSHFPLFDDIMLDSGAFSAETQGETIYLDAYILWLQLNLQKYPQIKAYVNLDDISDYRQSRKNLLKMRSEGLDPLPVYHYGEPENVLDEMCSEREYVGIGGLVKNASTAEIQILWEHIYKKYPDNKFHFFGVNVMKPFYKYQPYSIDSISWIKYSSSFKLIGYYKGLPDVLDISETGTGWLFPIHWKDLFLINAKALVHWQNLEWLKYVSAEKKKETPQMPLF